MKPIEHRLCTAPMMDWSDRHCRYFFRLLAPHAVLYTEMVTSGALTHGDVDRHLRFSAPEHPVALQFGGSEPEALAHCARLGSQWRYDEINLNCGCPSERVQHGAFGACLMAEPALVADCVKAMQDAAGIPVTVKHRLGIDSIEAFDFVRRFVETVARAGCRTFLVHARNAILKGLSPKDNRQVPPLKYEYAWLLKREFPELEIVVNGGIVSVAQAAAQLAHADGVMLGRAAYHDSHLLALLEAQLFGTHPCPRAEIAAAMAGYARAEVAAGTPLRAIARHMLGLYHGRPGARTWRRMLSDAPALARNDPELLGAATRAAEEAEQTKLAAA
ncbi:MAG TPA: tRNA dihydrouridine(20/20a) synthase DusA [Burkholderiales bacterium]|nr:tRNA dihydrouridine(20/20a) synthase DusA [Burkholderiales bacterium]